MELVPVADLPLGVELDVQGVCIDRRGGHGESGYPSGASNIIPARPSPPKDGNELQCADDQRDRDAGGLHAANPLAEHGAGKHDGTGG